MLPQTEQMTCFISSSSEKGFSRKIKPHFPLINLRFPTFLPTRFVHPVSSLKQDKTAVTLDISTITAVFTNAFCPISPRCRSSFPFARATGWASAEPENGIVIETCAVKELLPGFRMCEADDCGIAGRPIAEHKNDRQDQTDHGHCLAFR